MTTQLPIGTKIAIVKGGQTWFTGTIGHKYGRAERSNYGTDEEPNWYIEFMDESDRYHYWKQVPDGGTLQVISYPPV